MATRSARCVWVLLHISLLGALFSARSNLGALLLGSANISSFFVLLVTEVALFAALCCSNPGTCEPRPRTRRPHGPSSVPVRACACCLFLHQPWLMTRAHCYP